MFSEKPITINKINVRYSSILQLRKFMPQPTTNCWKFFLHCIQVWICTPVNMQCSPIICIFNLKSKYLKIIIIIFINSKLIDPTFVTMKPYWWTLWSLLDEQSKSVILSKKTEFKTATLRFAALLFSPVLCPPRNSGKAGVERFSKK